MIWKSRDDQFYWEIKGDNGETMAVSETYHSKASAKHAIAVVKAGAASGRVADLSDGSKFNRDLP